VGRPGTFEPGKSGNPTGRPKVVAEVRDLARAHTTRAIDRLVELMESEDGRIAVAASKELLDRGYGKATQPLEHSNADGSAPGIAVVFRDPKP
jgi:hypothetical protein